MIVFECTMFPPIIVVSGRSITEVWEKAVTEVFHRGVEVETEYGQKSKDAVLLMRVEEPLAEPRTHPGALERVGILGYVEEVLEGIHDHYVKQGKISYTYHERLFKYKTPRGQLIDQIEYIISKLSKAPCSRRAQAVTWQAWKDQASDAPPCLQRLWLRVLNNKLVMHSTWRSRDVFHAAWANMYALTELQKRIAERLRCEVGEYIDFSDSAHVYESSYQDVSHFLKVCEKRRGALA